MYPTLDHQTLANEEHLLLLASRLALTAEQEEEIRRLIREGCHVPRFYALAVRHKVLPLVSRHLIRLDANAKIPEQYKRWIDYAYLGNRLRNEALFAEVRRLLALFQEMGIRAVPLKGIILAESVYRDIGLRMLNDLDFLIPRSQIDAVSKAMRSSGYQVGRYDWAEDAIRPASRQKELFYRLHMGNLLTHVKTSENPFLRMIKVDFSYDVDLRKDFRASEGLLANVTRGCVHGMETDCLSSLDLLVHICIHLYKEASRVQWVYAAKDLNLIKFTDLREYALSLGSVDWQQVADWALTLNASRAVYFSFYYLYYLYGDEILRPILDLLPVDPTFLEEYGEMDYESARRWKKPFWERFCSLSNADEIDEASAYQKLKNELV